MTDEKEPPLYLRLSKQTGRKIIESFQFLSAKLKGIKKLLFKFLVDNHIGRKVAINLGVLFFIAAIAPISEYATNKQVYADLKKYSEPLDPIRAGELAEQIGEFTPGINEKADEVAVSMMLQNDSYSLSQELSINAGRDIEGPQRSEATYVVKPGETIMQIAEKFNLHVASILDANRIKPEDAKKIKSGMLLNIPSSDTSTSSEWIVAVNQAEEAERQAQEAARLAELKKKQLALSKLKTRKAYAADSTSSSEGYSGNYSGGLIVPISYEYISRGVGRGHTGVDYVTDTGTSVKAAGDGRVIKTQTGWSGGYGNQVLIDHGGGRVTRYAHLSSVNVGAGQTVSAGQVIGYSGSTGRSTGPHLHYELIINGRPVNP